MQKTKPVIEHPLLEPFEPCLKSFLNLAFDGGIHSLEEAGFNFGDHLENEKAKKIYEEGIFSAFAQTQSEVGKIYIHLEKIRLELIKQIKVMRTHKEQGLQEAYTQIEAIDNRQLILRRLMDGLLLLVLTKPWIFNQLAYQKHVSHPNLDELNKMLSLAEELNKKAKNELFLVSDITNIIQIGDLIKIRWQDDGIYLQLIELKSGEMNERLERFIDSKEGKLSEEDLNEVESSFGNHARMQVARMIRQRKRFRQFDLSIQDSCQTEQENDKPLNVRAKAPPLQSYLLLLPELVSDAREHDFYVHGINSCLWLIAITEKGLADIGELRNLHHWLFHIKNPELKCSKNEIPALNKEYPLVNLVAHNMSYCSSLSPLIWFPKELVIDLVTGRIVIFAQFDLDLYFKIAEQQGIHLSLITGKEAEEGKRRKASSPMLENPKAFGVKVKFPNGSQIRLRSSLFRSVYSNLIYPTEILHLISKLNYDCSNP